MGLLRPKSERKKRKLPEYRFLTCPMNGHQVCFCRGLCEPVDNRGLCGRYVPEGLVGRTQAAIAKYVKERASRADNPVQSTGFAS